MTENRDKAAVEAEKRKHESKEKQIEKQQRRIPIIEQKNLTYADADPNFKYRYILDRPGRIDKFLLAGWVPEEGDIHRTYSGKGREEASQSTGVVWRVMNETTGEKGILMKIPMEWYLQDRKLHDDMVLEQERALDPDGVIMRRRLEGATGNPNAHLLMHRDKQNNNK